MSGKKSDTATFSAAKQTRSLFKLFLSKGKRRQVEKGWFFFFRFLLPGLRLLSSPPEKRPTKLGKERGKKETTARHENWKEKNFQKYKKRSCQKKYCTPPPFAFAFKKDVS